MNYDLKHREEILIQVKKNLEMVQERMKRKAGQGKRELEFTVGDWVFVRLQPYRQNSVALKLHQKLGFRFFDPFQISQKINAAAYRLKLPEDSLIHDVFHISKLRPYRGPDPTQEIPNIPKIAISNQPVLTLISFIDSRNVYRQSKVIPQLLIQWSNSI